MLPICLVGEGCLAEQDRQLNVGRVHTLPVGNQSGKNSRTGQFSSLPICFNRIELSYILNIYGRQVSAGEWRDYAIDVLPDRALFSIYRHASERPLFVIEKNPKLARKQGVFSLVGQNGRILKRGGDLQLVLRVLEKKPKLVAI